MPYLDFRTLIVCNNRFSDEFVCQCFSTFGNLGIDHFIFTYDFDPSVRPAALGVETLKTLKPFLRSYEPRRSVRVDTAFNVLLYNGLSYDPMLTRLTVSRTPRIFLNLPIFASDWLDSDLSHLLYRRNLHPIFTSFERTLLTEPKDRIDRLLRIPRAVFCIDANFLFSLRAQPILLEMLQKKVQILPCISNSMSDYAGIYSGFHDLKLRIGSSRYWELCRSIRETAAKLTLAFDPIPRPRKT